MSRAEGVLLRYLSDAYKTLAQSVPDPLWNDELIDIAGFLRSTLGLTDSSLVEEWERMVSPVAEAPREAGPVRSALLDDPRMLRSRIRSELHLLVKALAARDYEEAATLVKSDVPEPWTPDRLEHALAPFFERYPKLLSDHRSRQSQWSILEEEGRGRFRARQVLLDPEDENNWYLGCNVELPREGEPEGPLLELLAIGN